MAYDDVTPAEAGQINTMNVASQRAGLGTVIDEMQAIGISNSGSIVVNTADILALEALSVVSGSYKAVYADVDASGINITTGTTGITGYIANVSVSGSSVAAFVRNTGSNLWITPVTAGSSSVWGAVVINDRVDWIVF